MTNQEKIALNEFISLASFNDIRQVMSDDEKAIMVRRGLLEIKFFLDVSGFHPVSERV